MRRLWRLWRLPLIGHKAAESRSVLECDGYDAAFDGAERTKVPSDVESGVALRLPPHSKTLRHDQCSSFFTALLFEGFRLLR
jgi:hypothetical protein